MSADHQRALGTEFEPCPSGRPGAERRPVERPGTAADEPEAAIVLADDGSGAAPGEAGTATITRTTR